MIKFLKKIIKYKTITPNDLGCQSNIKEKLKKIGFEVFLFNKKKVTNSIFFNRKTLNKRIDLMFVCHIDVVSVKKKKKWIFNPFILSNLNGFLIGRGVCDMKGSISCFLKSIEWFLKKKKKKNIMIIITSDEEGEAKYGTKVIVKILKNKFFKIKRALVGEPTSEFFIPDIIKIGRRGSLNLKVKITGKQGHSAYPEKSINPIHKIVKVFSFFFKTIVKKNSFQITSIASRNKTSNIIPNAIHLSVNIRYTSKFILNLKILNLKIFFHKEKCKYRIKIKSNSYPFFSRSNSNKNWIYKNLKFFNKKIKFSKFKGGTSDARFVNKLCKKCFEIGLKNKYAHKYNEKSSLKDLYKLTIIYYKLLCDI
ncbi:succinyl-diaminopimelate desuccinylase [Candidatus Vidania fulgoroideorum]